MLYMENERDFILRAHFFLTNIHVDGEWRAWQLRCKKKQSNEISVKSMHSRFKEFPFWIANNLIRSLELFVYYYSLFCIFFILHILLWQMAFNAMNLMSGPLCRAQLK